MISLRKFSSLLTLIMVGALVVTACSGGSDATATPSTGLSTSTTVPTESPNTPTPFPTVTPTPFPTVVPTPTPNATVTPIPTPTAEDGAGGTLDLPSEPIGEVRTVVNEIFGFTVDVPVEWDTTEGDFGFGELLVLSEAEFGVPRLLVDMEFAASLGTVKEMGEQTLTGLRNSIPDLEVLEESAITLEDGTAAYDYTLEFPSDTLPLRAKLVVIPRGSQIFQVFAQTVRADFETRLPDLIRLSRSFRLREATPFGVPRSQALNLQDFPPATLDPHLIEDATSAGYAAQVFGGLVRLDRQLNVVPDLAERWDISEGGLVYVFHLREDVFFHSGKQVTARDVKYSFERAADPATGSRTAQMYLDDILGVLDKLSGNVAEVAGVEVVNDFTVRITLTNPVTYFLSKMAHTTAAILNQENVESGGDSWFLAPDGIGPFKVKGWQPQVVMALERNAKYHGGAPKVPFVLIWNTGGDTTVMYEAGDLDVATIGGANAVAAQDQSSPLYADLQIVPELGIQYVGFNFKEPPFNDVRARKAFALAVDTEQLIADIQSGTVEKATGFLPLGMPGFDANLAALPFDPAQAKVIWDQVVAESELDLSTLSFQVNGLFVNALHVQLADMWTAALGVEITFVGDLSGDRGQALRENNTHLFDFGWIADYPDPQNFLDVLFHSEAATNIGSYANAQVDAILEQARIDPPGPARLQRYQEANRLMLEDAAAVPLWYFRNYLLVKPYVKNWFMSNQGIPDLTEVVLERSISL